MINSMSDAVASVAKVLDDIEGTDVNDLIYSRGSMTRFLKQFILEPLIVISQDLRGKKEINNVIDANINIFISLYKMTFDILLNVYGYETEFTINMLSSNDAYTEFTGLESADMLYNSKEGVYPLYTVEADDDDSDSDDNHRLLDDDFDVYTKRDSKYGGYATSDKDPKKIAKIYREVILEAPIKRKDISEDKSVSIKIKVLVAAGIKFIPLESFQKALKFRGDRASFTSRWQDFSAGAVSLKNLIFGGDLLEDYFQDRLKDKDALHYYIEKRRRDSATKLRKGALGFSRYYQMNIVSKENRQYLERVVGGKLGVRRYREKLLEALSSLMITTIDYDYEMVDICIHSIAECSEIPMKVLKNPKANEELNAILKFLTRPTI
jgi:hypothetical protein